ncbi:MAG: flagellin [Butyrivibrio sp.]|uniref:flagellin n=1 Tax=Butyrivibrio sp. TaxID=28121 RepID=UPI001B114E50|nr:flagellin [Butyrivibrio sp.]MBO6239974.1 flagellin [Butyrivibrio sp.]
MSSVGSVGSYGTSYSPYSTIASGGALQSAAQDASGLAIEQKTEAQTRGLDQGSENLAMGKSALNIEDSALEGITDYLQSIRELAVQAQNGLLSDEDKGYIQQQINQYLDGINDLANGTTFNEINLLDGSSGDLTIAADAEGSTANVSTYDSTVASLGLAGFDVTSGNFSIDDIDNALEIVTSSRANVGAETNRIDYASSYNSKASLELNGYAMDKNEDRAINALQDLKKKQALDQYQMMLQKKQQDDAEKRSQMFFA